jgi:hypothetical protein
MDIIGFLHIRVSLGGSIVQFIDGGEIEVGAIELYMYTGQDKILIVIMLQTATH